MLNLTYEFKLNPNKKQVAVIENTLDVCRSVWNFALRERKDWISSRKSNINSCSLAGEYIISADQLYPDYHKQAKALTEAKKDNEHLKSINAQVLQQTLRTLDRAFKDMKAKGLGFPRFRNRVRMRSFVYPAMLKDCLQGNRIKLPQLGWVKYRTSREIPGGFELKQARIIRKASGYFVMMSLALDVDTPSPLPHGEVLGVDVGLEKYLATSAGELVKRPKFFNRFHRELQLLQRRLKFKKKGSHKRARLLQKIARLHERIANTRKDFQFKLAHHLCEGTGMIFVEDIDFRIMAKGMLGKHTLDAGFGQFRSILKWVCWKRNIYFTEVEHRGTSQECPECGIHTGKKSLSERVHVCLNCGYATDRDVASAQVICQRGLNKVASAEMNSAACDDRAVGQPVFEIAPRGVLAGAGVNQSS